jgi:excisionase family DNA binding protein
MSETLTTKEAAERLGISPARIRQMVLSHQLPAEKFGRDLVIKADDLKLVADRPLGRPRNATTKKAVGKNGTKKASRK